MHFRVWRDLMSKELRRLAVCALAMAGLLTTSLSPAFAQGGTPPPANVVENPNYVVIPLETMVNRPAAEVWKRVGKYCDIAEWLQIPAGCKMLKGQEGEVGGIRSVAQEIMVAKTEYSYTYVQPAKVGQVYNQYHGTVEVRPVTATTSKIIYTLFYDNSMLPDDAARERDKENRTASFTRAVNNMKILAEGGTLPPRPARGAPPAGAPAAPAGRGN
jgi:hypothetical protein